MRGHYAANYCTQIFYVKLKKFTYIMNYVSDTQSNFIRYTYTLLLLLMYLMAIETSQSNLVVLPLLILT